VIVPESGIAVVESASFLHEMSTWEAKFSSGQSLRTETDGEHSDDTIMLRGGRFLATKSPSQTSSRYEFFVGTQDDFEAFDFDAWLKDRRTAIDQP